MSKLDIKLNRLKSHYPYLFPLNIIGSRREQEDLVKLKLQGIDVTKNMVIYNSVDNLKLVMLNAIIKTGRYIDCEFMNAYRLVNIYLGLDETFVSLQDIETDLSIVYFGYSEMENKRQGEILCQFIEQQIVNNRLVWLYYKGTKDSLSSKYPEVYTEIRSRNIQIIDFNSSKVDDIDEF